MSVILLCWLIVQIAAAALIDCQDTAVELPEQVGHYLFERERC